MNPKSNTYSKRKFQVDPRFELKIGTFVNSKLEISPPHTPKDPNLTCRHVELDLTKPKMNQKFDENFYPEEVVAMHTYGYAVAHKKYSQNIYDSYEKQWEDQERIRRCKSARVRSGNNIEPTKRRKDQHVLERILQDSKKKERLNRTFSQRNNSVTRLPLPPEEGLSGSSSRRLFYYG